MLFMIVEKFRPGKVKALYQRFDEKGRMMPEGVTYINSWINAEVTVCYQLMEADSTQLLNEWIANWVDLAEFEVVPVISSAEARQIAFES